MRGFFNFKARETRSIYERNYPFFVSFLGSPGSFEQRTERRKAWKAYPEQRAWHDSRRIEDFE
jgi:hypothetical protein